jgi:hypothetical protein
MATFYGLPIEKICVLLGHGTVVCTSFVVRNCSLKREEPEGTD